MAQAKTLTAAELRRATDYIATRPHAARNRAMLLTTHLAGLRVGEVALLSWLDAVDTSGQVREEIRLNADQTKGRHPRTVYVSPKLRKELQAYVNSIPARAPEAVRATETVRKCADEKKATAVKQLLYFHGGATQSRTGLNGFAKAAPTPIGYCATKVYKKLGARCV